MSDRYYTDDGEPICWDGDTTFEQPGQLVVDGQPVARGLVQRPEGVFYAKGFAAPPSFPLIDPAYMPRLSAELASTRSRISDIRMKGDGGQMIVNLDQGQQGYCWAHSSAHAVMLSRAVQNMPYVPLSAYAVACIIKQYRDEGGWAALSMDFIVNRGIPSQAKWPQLNKDRRNDNPETWTDAAKYKVTEGFWDSAAAQYDRKFTFQQRNTLLLCRQPVASDYMHMGHSVCDVDVVDGASMFRACRGDSGKLLDLPTHEIVWGLNNPVTMGLSVRYLNSWLNWGVNGMGILTGSKAIPDGSVCPLVSNAA